MKISKIMILASFLILTQTSHAESTYANIGVGLLDTDSIDNVGAGPVFRLGYLFSDVSNSFGIEAEANPMRVDIKDDGNRYYHSDRDMGLILASYLVYNFEMPNTQFTVRPKAGIVFPNLGDNVYQDSSNFGYGLNVIYNFKDDLSFFVGYGSFGHSVNQYSAGLEVFF